MIVLPLKDLEIPSEIPTIDDFETWYNQPPRRRCAINSDYVVFWPGPFSQWANYPMEIEGVTYSACEQYMMAEKARLFDDAETESAIMEAHDPAVQKALGRKVRGFNNATWRANAQRIIYLANLAKLTQHPTLLKMLLATGEREIVEGSADDNIWGIGVAFFEPDALDSRRWRGANWLGKAITLVRRTIRAQE